jgi:hypothetical protein
MSNLHLNDRPEAMVNLGTRATCLTALVVMAVMVMTLGAVASEHDPDEPPYPSDEWTAREAENFARTGEAPADQASDPAFLQRWQEQSAANYLEYQQRNVDDPDWSTGGNLCASWAEQCTGDPFRYAGVDAFYDDEGVVEPVAFLDRGGARLSGRVWAPMGATAGANLPGVVIINGSVQAPETLYWWAAQALVRQGYVVMTFDPRGQGRSDNATPDGEQGSNANPNVFASNLIDAIDFFLSTPDAPYPPNDGDDRATTPHNPLWDLLDHDRLGIVGHSLGASGVAVVQGIDPWPGSASASNPVSVAVAWDNLNPSVSLAGFDTVPRVPTMGQAGDYFLTPTPYTSPPDPDGKRGGFLAWREAGIDTYQLVIEGGTHYEWSLIPSFPTTRWEAGGDGGWGRPLAEHYTVAWLDRYLKLPGEPGFEDADARLLADDQEHDGATWRDRLSFYYRSSRHVTDRDGAVHVCEDIRLGCPAPADGGGTVTPAPDTDDTSPTPDLPSTGGGLALLGIGVLLAGSRAARRN